MITENIHDLLKNEDVLKLFSEKLFSFNTMRYNIIPISKYGDKKRDRLDVYIHQGKDAPYYFDKRLSKINGYALDTMKCNPDFDW